MKKHIQKSAVVAATVAAFSAAAVISPAPAQAGGPGTTYVKGNTQAACNAALSAGIGVAVGTGKTVTGIQHCYRVDEKWVGSRWLGSYVVN